MTSNDTDTTRPKATSADIPRPTLSSRLDVELLARLRRMAKIEHRSRNNYIELALMKILDEAEEKMGLPPVTEAQINAEIPKRKGRA